MAKGCNKCGATKPEQEYRTGRSTCRSCDSATRNAHRQKDGRSKINQANRDLWREAYAQAIVELGGSCATCGNSDPLCLEIDHVNNDGAEDRRAYGKGANRMRKMRSVGFREWPYELQLLCGFCHDVKGYEARRREAKNRRHHKRWMALKAEVLSMYSSSGKPECDRCGTSDVRSLDLDHVNNDGAEHRKQLGVGARFYASLKQAGWPRNRELNVLCGSCHVRKTRLSRGEW